MKEIVLVPETAKFFYYIQKLFRVFKIIKKIFWSFFHKLEN